MIAFLSSIIGFLSSGLPHLLDYFKARQDNAHELEMLRVQSELAKIETQGKLNAVGLQTDAQMYHDQIQLAIEAIKPTGIAFMDGLNASVRPVLAYAFFALYAAVKLMQWRAGLPWTLWTEEDQAIFAGIISFYYGQRAFKRLRG
jgi:hypothetical protein